MADLEATDFENPNPSIHDLFTYYNQIYFEGKLGPCTLQWSSKRMTLCAGVCQYSTYGGCEIRLSEPLLKYRPVSDLKNTLLHEMIHAYLFLTKGNKDHDDHGPCFQHMMMMINDFNLLDEERPDDGYTVTIYHNFTNEVDSYRTHHWRCVKCADLIKRAMNRTPSVSDCLTRRDACSHPRCHWHMHQKRCGGSYEKIHEPAGYVDKRKKAATPVSGDSKKPNDQPVDGDDANLTKSGQKRKMSCNGGTSKRGSKEPQVPVKTASLEDFFCPVQKGGGKIVYPQTGLVEKDDFCEKPTGGKNPSPGGINGKRKFSTLNDISLRESVSDTTEEATVVDLGSQSSSGKKDGEESRLPKVAAAPHMEESSVRTADEDVRRSLRLRRGKETIVSTDSRQNGSGKEALGICGDSPSRKKYKMVDELLKKQTGKEPLVILAWKNWVSYESDEELEEPLVNRRKERRKQKGQTALDPSEDTEMVAAEDLRSVSESPMDPSSEHPLDSHKVQNGHVSQVVFIDDGEEENPIKGYVVENKNICIELSDDEKVLEATGKKINGGQEQAAPSDHRFVPEQGLSVLRGSSDKHDLRQNSSTSCTTRMGASDTPEGKDLSSSPGDRLHGREESTVPTGIMMCPICNLVFRENERNLVVNKHIDECLAQCA